jgi:uncharacterized membrane protein YkvA (DUF1232 family)
MAQIHTLPARIDRDAAPPVALRRQGRTMPFKLTIELSDRDLRHFRRELKKTRESVRIADDEEILGAATDLVKTMRSADLPDFVTERLEQLEALLAMVTDEDWPLDDDERSPVLAGMAYLCDPEDLIPDDIPGIGMLDDAVMIELVFRELRHELDAYVDFCAYRESLMKKSVLRKASDDVAKKIAQRRTQLLARMRRRRQNEK